MNEIRVDFNVGPRDQELEIIGSCYYYSKSDDASFIKNALHKSIKKLRVNNEKFIVGLLDVFVNNVKKYEVGIIGSPKNKIKYEIKEL